VKLVAQRLVSEPFAEDAHQGFCSCKFKAVMWRCRSPHYQGVEDLAQSYGSRHHPNALFGGYFAAQEHSMQFSFEHIKDSEFNKIVVIPQ
jgi:hypothetical protein